MIIVLFWFKVETQNFSMLYIILLIYSKLMIYVLVYKHNIKIIQDNLKFLILKIDEEIDEYGLRKLNVCF